MGGAKKLVKKVAKTVGNQTLDIVSGGTMGEGVVGGITGQAAMRAAKEQADEAKKQAAREQAIIDKQDADIAKKRKLQQDVADERKSRMSQNDLLSGTETGVTNKLLGGK